MLNQRFIYGGVKKAMRRIGMKNPIFWISDPYFSFFSRKHGQKLTVFDWIHDDPGRTGSRINRVYRTLQNETLSGSRIVFTPSRVLRRHHGKADPNFHLIPHGVDYELFQRSGGKKPADIERFTPPVIGFIGTIGPAVDFGLLKFLAAAREDWSFVFIGEARQQLDELDRYPNISFLGYRPAAELPHYLRSFSAGISPYLLTPATQTVHPVKTYEYLAAGLPVVSTNLPELEPLRGMIELADGEDEFISRLEKVLREDTPERQGDRIRFARENSWESRFGAIEDIISKALSPGCDFRSDQSAGNATRSVTS